MRCLIFANTPAHVHLYRHVVSELRSRGHDVLVLGRDYGCTVDLLDWYDLPYEVYGYCATAKGSLLARLPAHYARAFRHAHQFDPDLVFGIGGYAAHVAALTRTPSVLVLDSETTTLDHAVSTPLSRSVLTPDTFRKDLGDDHYVFPGFKECAYLHPDVYERDVSIRDRLGLGPDDSYVILRLNAFGSHHDVGEGGITAEECRDLIGHLSDRVTVFVSDEGRDIDFSDTPAEPFSLHPALLHDALAEAELLVADTQTMVTEAALLGTPAIRSNSFVGESDMGNFLELEEEGLIFNVSSFGGVLEQSQLLLDAEDTASVWAKRRDEYLAEKCNLTSVLVEVAENEGHVDGVDALRPYGAPETISADALNTIENA
jgi:predicted glycosyltransferase